MSKPARMPAIHDLIRAIDSVAGFLGREALIAVGNVDRAQHFVYDTRPDGLDPIALVFDGAGSLTNRYLHGPLVDQVLADELARS